MTIELEPGGNLLNIKLKPISPKLEDLDLSVFKTVNNSLKVLHPDEKERVLGALNFLYDALAVPTYVQSYISIYRALSYLMDSIGCQGNSRDTAAETFKKFRCNGVLTEEQEASLTGRFEKIHSMEHHVAEGKKVKIEELDKIKEFFKEFLIQYIEYTKMVHK